MQRETELEERLEHSSAAAVADRYVDFNADGLYHTGNMLDYPGMAPYFPVSLPPVYSPFTFSVPVMTYGWESEQLLYSAVPTVTVAPSFLYETASSLGVEVGLIEVSKITYTQFYQCAKICLVSQTYYFSFALDII